jgi:hypothetical protein
MMRRTACLVHPRRAGAALVLAILLLVVLDCIIIGALQVAAQQRRIAGSRLQLLRAQLVAESALRRALVEWPQEPLPPGTSLRRTLQDDGILVLTIFEGMGADLALLTAFATPASGPPTRYSAALLARPPAVPPDTDLSGAALSAASVFLSGSALISADPPSTCTAPDAPAIRTDGAVMLEAGAAIEGTVGPRDVAPLQVLDRIAARAGVNAAELAVAAADTILDGPGAGVLIAGGIVIIASDAHFDGLILARGGLSIEAGAALRGAVHVAGDARVSGTVRRDPCAVAAALAAAQLTAARPVRGRSWVPAFPGS